MANRPPKIEKNRESSQSPIGYLKKKIADFFGRMWKVADDGVDIDGTGSTKTLEKTRYSFRKFFIGKQKADIKASYSLFKKKVSSLFSHFSGSCKKLASKIAAFCTSFFHKKQNSKEDSIEDSDNGLNLPINYEEGSSSSTASSSKQVQGNVESPSSSQKISPEWISSPLFTKDGPQEAESVLEEEKPSIEHWSLRANTLLYPVDNLHTISAINTFLEEIFSEKAISNLIEIVQENRGRSNEQICNFISNILKLADLKNNNRGIDSILSLQENSIKEKISILLHAVSGLKDKMVQAELIRQCFALRGNIELVQLENLKIECALPFESEFEKIKGSALSAVQNGNEINILELTDQTEKDLKRDISTNSVQINGILQKQYIQDIQKECTYEWLQGQLAVEDNELFARSMIFYQQGGFARTIELAHALFTNFSSNELSFIPSGQYGEKPLQKNISISEDKESIDLNIYEQKKILRMDDNEIVEDLYLLISYRATIHSRRKREEEGAEEIYSCGVEVKKISSENKKTVEPFLREKKRIE